MTYNCKSTVSEILEVVVDILETAKINLENGQMTDDAYDDIRIAVSSLEIFEDDLDEEPEDFYEVDVEDDEADPFQQMGLESESMGAILAKALNIRRR